MLTELIVTDLGVVERAQMVVGPGLTALTGETGTGKTMIVDALGLLLGHRADTDLVRAGAAEAIVEGRFTDADGVERVLCRVVPADGRSRAYVDGRAATAAALGEHATKLLELHGQHGHHSLLEPRSQREALDCFGQVETGPLDAAVSRLRHIEIQLEGLGGDGRARAREMDLLRFQLAEISAAAIDGPDEDGELARIEQQLAGAEDDREAAVEAWRHLDGEDGIVDRLRVAAETARSRSALASVAVALDGAVAETADAASRLRHLGETLESDPARLAQVQERRRLLADLRRKYGETLAEVLAEQVAMAARLDDLESHDATVAHLENERAAAAREVARAQSEVCRARETAAPALVEAVNTHLGDLALAGASVSCTVDGDSGERVRLLLVANPGEPAAPVAKAASGGELARVMLALHLVLRGGAETLVFDEVDAGVGGAAGRAVGAALAALGRSHQVLVVTHLPQVAAHADQQIVVTKESSRDRTASTVREVQGDGRVAELARMLAGDGESESARRHATELLDEALTVAS